MELSKVIVLGTYGHTDRWHQNYYDAASRVVKIIKSIVNMTCTRSVHCAEQNKTLWIEHCKGELFTRTSLWYKRINFSADKNTFLEFSTRPAGQPDQWTSLKEISLLSVYVDERTRNRLSFAAFHWECRAHAHCWPLYTGFAACHW